MYMKSIRNIQKIKLFAILFCVFGCFFYSSCGLETIVIVAPPTNIFNSQNISTPSDDYNYWYCDFETAESKNDSLSGADFIGTEIYYRIYKNFATLTSHKNSISGVNTTTNTTAAAKRIIETYHYQTLNTNPEQGLPVFIPSVGYNRRVRFRIKSYQKSTDIMYRAAISVPYATKGAGYLAYTASDKAIDEYTYGDFIEVFKGAYEVAGTAYSDLRVNISSKTWILRDEGGSYVASGSFQTSSSTITSLTAGEWTFTEEKPSQGSFTVTVTGEGAGRTIELSAGKETPVLSASGQGGFYMSTNWTLEGELVDYNSIIFVVPYRNVTGGARSFDFFDDYETKLPVNSEPVQGDADYEYSETFSTENTYFVLTSGHPEQLLVTVRSRCRFLKLRPWEENRIIDILEKCGSDPERARLAAVSASM